VQKPYGPLITKCDTVSGNGKGAATRLHHSRWSQQLPQPLRFPKGHKMNALGIAAATAIALAPFSVVATTPDVAQAAPCAGVFANPTSCQNCLLFVEEYHTANVCDKAAPSRPAQAAPSMVPVQTPEAPPEPALLEPALPEPAPLTVTPVQTPTPQVVSPTPPPPSTIPVAAHEEPTQPTRPWWPMALGYGVLATAVGLVAWMISRGDGARI
jgi:hypothetical protein